MASVDSGSTWTFTYNALGQRVGWNGSLAWYDPEGNYLGMPGSYSMVKFVDNWLAYVLGDTWFLHRNNIGSTTMVTSHAGSVLQDIAFYPWGDVWFQQYTTGYSFGDIQYFDIPTNSSITPARFYTNEIGHWLSPDPLGQDAADPSDPQTWNMYAYARNNPTTLTDPEGTDAFLCLKNWSGGQDCAWYSDEDYAKYAAAQNAANQGINAPVANDQNLGHPSGDIMCGSSVCGTVTYGEAPSQDTTDSVVNLGLGVWGLGRAAVSIGAGLVEGALDGMLGTGTEEATSAIAGGATAYPTEIAGYKVGQHVFDRMAEDLGHRIPSQVVKQVIEDGETLPGKFADTFVKYLPTAGDHGVTVVIKQSTQEIIMTRVGAP